MSRGSEGCEDQGSCPLAPLPHNSRCQMVETHEAWAKEIEDIRQLGVRLGGLEAMQVSQGCGLLGRQGWDNRIYPYPW